MTARGAVVVMAAGCSAGVTSTEEAAGPEQVQGTSTVAPPVSPAPSPSPTGPVGVLPIAGEVGKVDKGQLPPVISSISTTRKVVFLTIDDGWEQDPGFARQVRGKRVPITVFATRDAVEAKGPIDRSAENGRFLGAGGWPYFKELGVPVENHTLSHPNLRTLGYDGQKAEICGASTVIKRQVGVRPTLFRPPFGNYNTDTLRAAKACGIKAVLLWTASVQPGGKIAYQTPDKKLRPGDILLLHFRPNLSRDFRVLVNKIRRRGFELGNLEAYLAAAMR
ncbi:polysaccharide deacetylase family protein [Acrocarpospora catenulata]|uniref:polysaccharide deacetylase family protein n=1 Tax=Acrocarpospora catenulata TaxID=2836182 RepID=UPI002023B1C6|nr:polysaccharide deacetylase family protein [Acrocarpospora catenulata]